MNGVVEMGYYITLTDQNLSCKKDISKDMNKMFDSKELYYFWDCDNEAVRHGEGYLKWNTNFIKDLLTLKDMGVRGSLTCYGEEGEYYKFEIDNSSVKEYFGKITFPRKPGNIFKDKQKLDELD